MIYNGEEFYVFRYYDIDLIIDCVGGGDFFFGGVIYGLFIK